MDQGWSVAYGFRVFSVELLSGMSRKPEETWELGTGEQYSADAQTVDVEERLDGHTRV